MSISEESELQGMKEVSKAVAITLREMRKYAKIGMNSQELDQYGARLLADFGARSAPKLAYNFPGHTCISVNDEVAHGIPTKNKIFRDGDLINIDVSAELNGFWADNGGSFVLGEDKNNFEPLVEASRDILKKVISGIKGGIKISFVGHIIQREAKKMGFRVIKNLAGHGVGRSLHEKPHHILNYRDLLARERFKTNSVVAIETFISTASSKAVELNDGWTLVGDRGGYVAQHEHTLIVGKDGPIILTEENGIWD
ncbi:MAG: type I methionyl aminopeptidase [Bacteroidia bacterium]|nr:type I methionyl aminopeptidase [Bacteroidia bacterium]